MSVSFPVECKVGNETFHARASTLGGGGLFIGATRQLAPGTQISLRFRPAKHLPFIPAQGRVIYQVPNQGAAIEFTEIAREHRHLLLRLIHHKTGDRRRYPRVRLATQIESEEGMSLGFSRDVSTGGMFIETKEPLAVGTMVNLRFHLDGTTPIVVAEAEVVYQVAKLGMGVLFLNLSPEDRERIEAYVGMSPALPAQTPAAESTN